MALTCKLFGHKFKAYDDVCAFDIKPGPKVTITSKTCERCGEKFYSITCEAQIKSADEQTSFNAKLSFQPKLKGDWNVTKAA